MTRRTAMTAYAVVLLAWCLLIGIPNDPAGVVLWIWVGTLAWEPPQNNDGAPRPYLDFWRDWWKPLLLMVGY